MAGASQTAIYITVLPLAGSILAAIFWVKLYLVLWVVFLVLF